MAFLVTGFDNSDMTRIKAGIFGASGRMGSLVADLVAAHYSDRLEVTAALSGQADGLDPFSACDLVIDFSLPAGTERLTAWLAAAASRPVTVVSGTTGCSEDQLAAFLALGDRRKVMHATNFSAGVAAMARLLHVAGPLLASLGYSAVLTETHHRHKKDAPSGTALTLTEALEASYPDGLQTHSIRAGEIVGRHEISFYGDHDTISLGHDALDRGVFARGAIEASLWLHSLTDASGHYTIDDFITAKLGQAPGAATR